MVTAEMQRRLRRWRRYCFTIAELPVPSPILVIACGALAREIQALKRLNHWQHLHLQCMDASLHNRPEQITERLREKIRAQRAHYQQIFIGYADCGTGGALDRMLLEESLEGQIHRLPGAHCYEFYAGHREFAELQEAELGTFYLTDFLVRHFQYLVIELLQLDQHPELQTTFFAGYHKLVYLSQTHDRSLLRQAKEAALRLDLEFVQVHSGYGLLEIELKEQLGGGG